MRGMPPQSDKALTVTELTRRVKSLLERELGTVWVSGEISNWRPAASGHAYFTLKDDACQIDAVMWRGSLSRLRFDPENGLEVLACGQITVYERQGRYQIVVSDMLPRGVGALQQKFERLKAKLQAEGLFDPALKKPLPLLPRRIGVVTSPTGAAIRDILNVIGRRFAGAHLLLYPARVQGDGAAAEIAAGIRALDEYGVDVMIVGRGGGSLEDLWPFNEEIVVRAVHAAETPVISAVGHEIDFTLCDFAADLRAPTPSAAAELVVQERRKLADRVAELRMRAQRAMHRKADTARQRLDAAARHYLLQRPEALLRQPRQDCDEARKRLETALKTRLERDRARLDRAGRALALLSPAQRLGRLRDRLLTLENRLHRRGKSLPEACRARLSVAAARLDAMSPLAILGRGYALAWKLPENTLVRNAASLKKGDRLSLRFGGGAAGAVVDSIHTNDGFPNNSNGTRPGGAGMGE